MLKRPLTLLVVTAIVGLGIVVLAVVKTAWPAIKPVFKDAPLNLNELTPNQNVIGETQTLLFAEDLGPVRFMTWTPEGVLLASITRSNRVVALPDENRDGRADQVIDVLTDLNLPHGLAFHGQDLYIAETSQVIRLKNFQSDFSFDAREVIIPGLPAEGNHFTRTIVIGPDEKLYVSIGSSCNVCNEQHPWRAGVLQANLDGSDIRVFASGLRNAVGLTFHPETGELWGTENGRDLIGDNIPPEEINIIRDGANYGWPICYGDRIHDTAFDKNTYIRDPCADTTPPAIAFQAHTAPLGLRFYTGQMFPEFAGNLFVAYHGSWNRSVPVGYSVQRFSFDAQGGPSEHIFMNNWLQPDGSSSGRPVDIIFDSHGAMYISDDKAGVIYLVTKDS